MMTADIWKKYDEHTPDKSQAELLTDSYGVVHNQPDFGFS